MPTYKSILPNHHHEVAQGLHELVETLLVEWIEGIYCGILKLKYKLSVLAVLTFVVAVLTSGLTILILLVLLAPEVVTNAKFLSSLLALADFLTFCSTILKLLISIVLLPQRLILPVLKFVLLALSDATVYAFLSTQPKGSQLVHEDLEQLHDDDLEEMDLKWNMANLLKLCGQESSIRELEGYHHWMDAILLGYDKSNVECVLRWCLAFIGCDMSKHEISGKTWLHGISDLRSVDSKEYELGLLRTELEKVKQEKEGVDFKIAKFDKSAKDLNEMITHHLHLSIWKPSTEPTFEPQPSPDAEYHVPTPNESPLHVVHSHGSDEGSLKLTELTNLVTKTHLVENWRLGVKTGKARKRARVVLSEDEEDDSSKQGRKISDIDEDLNTYFAQDDEVVHDQDTAKEGQPEDSTAGITVSTAPINISTARETHSTAGRVVYGRRSKEARKDKGKAIMTEPEPEKKSKKLLEQERLGLEEAIRLQKQVDEEEKAQIARDEEIARQLLALDEERVTTETKTTKDIDWNDPSVQKPIFEKVWDFNHNFVPMDLEIEKEKKKPAEGDGSSKNYKILSEMLYDFDRQDIVDILKAGQEVHIPLMHNGIAIHMLTEKKYPLSQEMISKMLSKRLEVDQESTQAYELLKFIRSKVKK
ncbi:hypothetical protein Tco_0407628 [Tanacetum coccineum]